jgi:aspartate aminotransferase/aminotransferase
MDSIGLEYLSGEATFYFFVSLGSSSLGSEAFCERLLREKGVSAVPGLGYGASCDQFIRISVGTETMERTKHGIQAIRDLIASTSGAAAPPARDRVGAHR